MKTMLLIIVALLCGCSTWRGEGPATAGQVGLFSASQTDATRRPRIVVLPFNGDFNDKRDVARTPDSLGDFTSAQLGEMLTKSMRFAVVPTADLSPAITESTRGRWMQNTSALDVDYVVIGSISKLSVSKSLQDPDMLQRVKGWVHVSQGGPREVVSVNCAISFSIINPSNGDVVVSNNSEYTREARADELGIDVDATHDSDGPTTLPTTMADQDQVVRLAADDAVRRSLPKIDRWLQTQPHPAVPGPRFGSASPTIRASNAAVKNICPVCGTENEPGAKFCKHCGAKLN